MMHRVAVAMVSMSTGAASGSRARGRPARHRRTRAVVVLGIKAGPYLIIQLL